MENRVSNYLDDFKRHRYVPPRCCYVYSALVERSMKTAFVMIGLLDYCLRVFKATPAQPDLDF